MKTKIKISLSAILFAFAFIALAFLLIPATKPIDAYADSTFTPSETTVFRMLGDTRVKLDEDETDGFAFSALMDKATYESLAANQSVYFIIIPTDYKDDLAAVGNKYYRAVKRITTEGATYGNFDAAASGGVLYVRARLVDAGEVDVYGTGDIDCYELIAGVKNLVTKTYHDQSYFAVACIETKTVDENGKPTAFTYEYAQGVNGVANNYPESTLHNTVNDAVLTKTDDFSELDGFDLYDWFGGEEYPVIISGSGDYTALKAIDGSTYSALLNSFYFDVDESVSIDASELPTGMTAYTVTWKNGDDDTLETDSVLKGTTPVYKGETPTKTQTAQYTYSYSAWDKSLSKVIANITYTATFTPSLRSYTVNFDVWSSSDTVSNQTIDYGAKVSKPSDPSYSGYAFAGWYNGASKWDFDTDTIEGTLDLQAKFVSISLDKSSVNILAATTFAGNAPILQDCSYSNTETVTPTVLMNGESVSIGDIDIDYNSSNVTVSETTITGVARGYSETGIATVTYSYLGVSEELSVSVLTPISTKADLDALAYAYYDSGNFDAWGAGKRMNGDSWEQYKLYDVYYVLTCDIDYAYEEFNPIAAMTRHGDGSWVNGNKILNRNTSEGDTSAGDGRYFFGTLDGDDHAIMNAMLSPSYTFWTRKCGGENIFGYLSGTLKNIAFTNAAGWSDGWETQSFGIVGKLRNGTIENVYVEITVNDIVYAGTGASLVANGEGTFTNVIVNARQSSKVDWSDGIVPESFSNNNEGHSYTNCYLISKTFASANGATCYDSITAMTAAHNLANEGFSEVIINYATKGPAYYMRNSLIEDFEYWQHGDDFLFWVDGNPTINYTFVTGANGYKEYVVDGVVAPFVIEEGAYSGDAIWIQPFDSNLNNQYYHGYKCLKLMGGSQYNVAKFRISLTDAQIAALKAGGSLSFRYEGSVAGSEFIVNGKTYDSAFTDWDTLTFDADQNAYAAENGCIYIEWTKGATNARLYVDYIVVTPA